MQSLYRACELRNASSGSPRPFQITRRLIGSRARVGRGPDPQDHFASGSRAPVISGAGPAQRNDRDWYLPRWRDLRAVPAALLAFQDYYQQIATPFEWKFTKSDLDLLLKRLTAHGPGPVLAA
jgi:hypothetical protein